MTWVKGRIRRFERDESGLTLIELLITATLMLVAVGVASDGLFNLSRSATSAQLHTFSLTQNRVGLERLTYLLRQATYAPDTNDTNRGTHPIISNITAQGLTFTSRAGGTSTAAAPITRFVVQVNGTTLQIGQSTCTMSTAGAACVWSNPVMRDLITGLQISSTGPCASKGADNHPFRYYKTSSPTASLQEVALNDDPTVSGSNATGSNVSGSNVSGSNVIPPGFLNSTAGSPAGTGKDDGTMSTIDTVQISLFTQETGAGIRNTCESLSARVNLRNLTFTF